MSTNSLGACLCAPFAWVIRYLLTMKCKGLVPSDQLLGSIARKNSYNSCVYSLPAKHIKMSHSHQWSYLQRCLRSNVFELLIRFL
jgi:hypothetical protein